MKHRGIWVGLIWSCLLSACSDDPKPGNESEPVAGDAGQGNDAGAASIGQQPGASGASDGEQLGVSQRIDSKGGELQLDGVTISVPKGALAAPTELSLRRVGSEAPGYELYSDVFELAPLNLTFARPVQISFDYEGDQRLANLFTSQPRQAGYFWAGTTSSAQASVGEVVANGRFFVANGAAYDESPDVSCTRLDVVDGVFSGGRSINLLARATDCQERAVVGLSDGDFTGLEDGEPVMQAGVALREPAAVSPFVTVLVDMRLLAASPDEAVEALDSALLDLKELDARVGISLYGGAGATTDILAPTLDFDAVHAAVAELSSFALPKKFSGGSYAAAAHVVTRQRALRDEFRERNAGGALGEGFVIWLSAAASDEDDDARAGALSSIREAGDVIINVPLGAASESMLAGVAFAAPEPDALYRAVAAAVQRTRALIRSSYWLGYCSGQTSGSHLVGARVNGPVFQIGRTGVYDATGSLPGCDIENPLESCEGRECGGAGCGACDDTNGVCDPATGRCLSFCETENWCGDETHQNANGYEQACPDSPTSTACGDECVNLSSDSQHCGECTNACPSGSSCRAGECVCDPGYDLCDGSCVDLALNSKHCGMCGNACGSGEGCFSGGCSSTCPTSLHGPPLVKVPTPGGGIMCIDSTEVTIGQYEEFVADRAGDASGQIPECEWNLYFHPPDECTGGPSTLPEPLKHPQECVDWCDAAAFCSWAGKRLCGGLDQRNVPMADLADATKDAWYNACSSGGVNHYPFGDTCNTMPCILTGLVSIQVPAGYGCQASGAYQGVWDLVGNVAEWEDSCSRDPIGGGKNDFCQIRGRGNGAASSVPGSCADWDRDDTAWCSAVPIGSTRRCRSCLGRHVGFRCCAR
jgi:sulfatase modifying factor 1